MALSLLAANNAQTVLASGISSTATTMTVNTGTGVLFPSPAPGASFFKLTLVDAATGTLTEIVHVTQRSGDAMTIERGQEGTTPRIWSANDIAANMMTAGTLSYILSNFQPLDATLTALAGLATGADKLPYFTGTDTAAQTDLTAVGRGLIGQATVADVLTYLGLGAGAPAIGIPFFWPSSAMPNAVMPEWSSMVFLKFNGSTFSATTYPKLALVIPSLTLPDARGEFPRIWDDGRGVDSGRALLSAQSFAIQNITGRLRSRPAPLSGGGTIVEANGVFSLSSGTGGTYVQLSGTSGSANADETTFDASLVANTAAETRPRNIAFNFLVRAK